MGSDLSLAFAPVLVAGVALVSLLVRHARLREASLKHQTLLITRGHSQASSRLVHPEVDLQKCIGCGACVRACPEQGVLALLHGQAAVVHGARCVGHGECAAVCPTGAIALTLGDLKNRRDLPALNSDFSVVGVPGLFIAGELSGYALVRTAVAQGTAVADAVRTKPAQPLRDQAQDILDLLIVGAGPAGLACALRATERGLRFRLIEQEEKIGGTIAAYPRRKLVMTQPLDLPLHGRLSKLRYTKEQLVSLWEQLTSKHKLPVSTGVRLLDLARSPDGVFRTQTTAGEIVARNVCLALGRRGTPRKLGVPGETLPKVSHSLIDAASYVDRRIVVVGGGDSAVEAALALSLQPGNRVTLVHRGDRFTRLTSLNDSRLSEAIGEGKISLLLSSQVQSIEPDFVAIASAGGSIQRVDNDEVFIFAGGEPPYPLLQRAQVSMDPADRPPAPKVVDRTGDLLGAVVVTFVCSAVIFCWAYWFRAYYGVMATARPAAAEHSLLRPTGPVGLATGIGACLLISVNLIYLARRSHTLGRFLPGSLRVWMATHVFTGLTSVLLLFVHCGFAIRPTVGGHAMIALGLVILSGSIGRYLYAQVPRAANGREVRLDELRTELAQLSAEWDRNGNGFGSQVRTEVEALVFDGPWRSSILARIGLIAIGQWRLSRCLERLHRTGRREGVPEQEMRSIFNLARRAHRLSLAITHYQELTAVLSSWRYFHRWLGILMVVLGIVHVVTATRYGSLAIEHWLPWWRGTQ